MGACTPQWQKRAARFLWISESAPIADCDATLRSKIDTQHDKDVRFHPLRHPRRR